MMLFPVLVSHAFIVSSTPLNYRVALCDKMCLLQWENDNNNSVLVGSGFLTEHAPLCICPRSPQPMS